MRRLTDILLLLVIVIGGGFAWRSGRERSRLQETFTRLSRKTGDLTIGDPSRVHLHALNTQGPLNLAWRVYLPANYHVRLATSLGGSESTTSSASNESIARMRIREGEDGLLEIYWRFTGGSTRMRLGDHALAKLLHGRWDRILVEQLGSSDVASLDPDQPAILVRLTLPEDIQAEARKTLSEDAQKRFIPTLFELKLGPPNARP